MNTETMELMVVDAQNAVQIFTGGGMAAILDGIEAKVRAIPLDPSTATGREEIRSVAYRVAKTKVALDAEGKKLTEGWRTATAKVNEERKRATERLESLADEVRKPLTDFENKEKIRVAAHEEALSDITGLHAMVAATPDAGLVQLETWSVDLRNSNVDREWEEFMVRATAARAAADKYIMERLDVRKKWEVEQEELARFRKEEAERLQRERDERLKAEAAEKARLEAERKAKEAADAEAKRVIEAANTERDRVQAETRRVEAENERLRLEAAAKAKAEQDRLAAEARAIEVKRMAEENAKIAALKKAADAEAARIASEKKAEAEKLAAEVKATDELKAAKDKAKRDAEAAVVREREKVERERKAAEDARLKREADEKLRAKIRAEMIEDFMALPLEGVIPSEFDALQVAGDFVDAIMDGKVRHVKVVF